MKNIIEKLREAYINNKAEALNLLPQLFEAVDDGKIIEFPYKVGSTAYRVIKLISGEDIIVKGKISDYMKSKAKEEFYFTGAVGIYEYNMWYDLEWLGKAVFLTFEEAEEALKERGNNGNSI